MNALQMHAIRGQLSTTIRKFHGDDFHRILQPLQDAGEAVRPVVMLAIGQMMANPNYGVSDFLNACGAAPLNQLAIHYGIGLPDPSGKFPASSESPSAAELSFDLREFHPQIIEHSKQLFLNQHYPAAVQEACKVYLKALQSKSGCDKDGLALMAVLGNGGRVRFSSMQTETDKNYHNGLESISRGIVSAFRNVSAHETAKSLGMSPVHALDILGTVSYLLRALDTALILAE